MYHFYVGQKVVCIDATSSATANLRLTLNGLTEGAIYTVRAVAGVPNHTPYLKEHLQCGVCLWVEEIVRPSAYSGGPETGYSAARFRPLVKTDISVFQAMLNPTPQHEDA